MRPRPRKVRTIQNGSSSFVSAGRLESRQDWKEKLDRHQFFNSKHDIMCLTNYIHGTIQHNEPGLVFVLFLLQ